MATLLELILGHSLVVRFQLILRLGFIYVPFALLNLQHSVLRITFSIFITRKLAGVQTNCVKYKSDIIKVEIKKIFVLKV